VRLGQRRLQRGEGVEEKVLLARPAAVDGRLADTGPRRDPLDAQALDPGLGEQGERRLDDGVLGTLAAGPARAAVRGRRRC
jgi:hypothetical protein